MASSFNKILYPAAEDHLQDLFLPESSNFIHLEKTGLKKSDEAMVKNEKLPNSSSSQDFSKNVKIKLDSNVGCNELFFGSVEPEKKCKKDHEEKVRYAHQQQLLDRQKKLDQLKMHAVAANDFREQQETARRQRFEEMRSRDQERRLQVEDRRRKIETVEKERIEAMMIKNSEREQRIEIKKRQEKSNVVFAFGSSTPRLLDPKDPVHHFAKRCTSASGTDGPGYSNERNANDCTDSDRKRAMSAHGLNKKDEMRVSTSMYEIFNWDDQATSADTPGARVDALKGDSEQKFWAARRRTDLVPTPILNRDSPRAASGMTDSKLRLHCLTSPRQTCNSRPLHENPKLSKSMSHIGPKGSQTPLSRIPAERTLGTSSPLDKRTSRSTLALSQPKMTRSEILRRKKLRERQAQQQNPEGAISSPTSRPQSSNSNLDPPGVVRRRSSPKKARPLSIAVSSPVTGSADQNNAEKRTPKFDLTGRVKKASNLSTSDATPKRAKSFSAVDKVSPNSRVVGGATTRKTPAQVKAEDAAKKKSRSLRTTPMPSPAVESRPLVPARSSRDLNKNVNKTAVIPQAKKNLSPGSAQKNKISKPLDATRSKVAKKEKEENTNIADVSRSSNIKADVKPEIETSNNTETVKKETEAVKIEVELLPQKIERAGKDTEATQNLIEIHNQTSENEGNLVLIESSTTENQIVNNATEIQPIENQSLETSEHSEQLLEQENSQLNTAARENVETAEAPTEQDKKPAAGYASEEEYRTALAEKRREAREAKERQIELERQRQLEEEERERKEEEMYLRLMEEQRKAEQLRLEEAIDAAEKARQIEAAKRAEEERQRIEAERIEEEKRVERLRKEEEERQLRKIRVSAIMSRTRGLNEKKTQINDLKVENENIMTRSMAEELVDSLPISMTDSMFQETYVRNEQDPFEPQVDKNDKDAQNVDSIAKKNQENLLIGLNNQENLIVGQNGQENLLIGQNNERNVTDEESQKNLLISVSNQNRENFILNQNNQENLLIDAGSNKNDDRKPMAFEDNFIDFSNPNSLITSNQESKTTNGNVHTDEINSELIINDKNIEILNNKPSNGHILSQPNNLSYQSNINGNAQIIDSEPGNTVEKNSINFEFDEIIDLSSTKIKNFSENSSDLTPPPLQPIIAFEQHSNLDSSETS